MPVVLGAGNYSAVAPPNSHIDATKMSPRQLAKKLRQIAADETLYESYFDWKSRFKVIGFKQKINFENVFKPIELTR